LIGYIEKSSKGKQNKKYRQAYESYSKHFSLIIGVTNHSTDIQKDSIEEKLSSIKAT
jgi:hypothetical protein